MCTFRFRQAGAPLRTSLQGLVRLQSGRLALSVNGTLRDGKT
jgi:hypothetical protein